MAHTNDLMLNYHKTLQDLANHYNSVNWNVHSIFFVLHSGLSGLIALSLVPPSGAFWQNWEGSAIALVLCGGGVVLVKAWQRIIYRHDLFIKTLYKQMQEVERELDFKVHQLIRPAINAAKANGEAGMNSAGDQVDLVQLLTCCLYCVGAAIVVLRFFVLPGCHFPKILASCG